MSNPNTTPYSRYDQEQSITPKERCLSIITAKGCDASPANVPHQVCAIPVILTTEGERREGKETSKTRGRITSFKTF